MEKYIYAADFETVVLPDTAHQTKTSVWSSAFARLFHTEVLVHHSIEESYNWLERQNHNIILYYHNAGFDSEFWLSYLLSRNYEYSDNKRLEKNQFKTLIDANHNFYSLKFRCGNHDVLIYDSLKLMPMTLKKLAKDFEVTHQKKEMEYKKDRYPGCKITDEEMEYIKNDVLALKECLEIMYKEGHTKLTIGSCCMSEYKKTLIMGIEDFRILFPNLKNITLDECFGACNMDAYLRKSYKGAICLVNPDIAGKIIEGGETYDVNSLYPYVQHSSSGNYYPVGYPHFFIGSQLPDVIFKGHHEYFIRGRFAFQLKPGKIPFIQMKNTLFYRQNQHLTTSALFRDGKYYHYIKDSDGKIKLHTVELTLTRMDYELLHEQYDVFHEEILDGCYFGAEIGLFDEYINKYNKIKEESTGARRVIAKLFNNNLYGKFSMSDDSSYRIPYLDKGIVKYRLVVDTSREPIYIPVGSYITSYARCYTIKAAQANISRFCYCDTDSIHVQKDTTHPVGIQVHPTKLGCWKKENTWDRGKFVRQKTYIEQTGEEYLIRACGMPDESKQLYLAGHRGRELEDFDIGLVVGGKLRPKHVEGGVVLMDSEFTMRK